MKKQIRDNIILATIATNPTLRTTSSQFLRNRRNIYANIGKTFSCVISSAVILTTAVFAEPSDEKWDDLLCPNGADGDIYAIATSGSNVYVGGTFYMAGGIIASNIAKWNGHSWSALGGGVNGRVCAIAVSGNDVYAGGYFTLASHIAGKAIINPHFSEENPG